MKPAIVSHRNYKSSLCKRSDIIYPDKSKIPAFQNKQKEQKLILQRILDLEIFLPIRCLVLKM